MPSELQPCCLVIQATEALKRPQSVREFGKGSKRKVANSFSMGVVIKMVILAMGGVWCRIGYFVYFWFDYCQLFMYHMKKFVDFSSFSTMQIILE